MWQLKRFVAVPGGHDVLGRTLLFRSTGGELWSAPAALGLERARVEDDDVCKDVNVVFTDVSGGQPLDLRVWQLLLVLGGQAEAVGELCEWARRRVQAADGGGPSGSRDAPSRLVAEPVGSVAVGRKRRREAAGSPVSPEPLHDVALLRGVMGHVPADAVSGESDDGVPLAVLRPTEIVLALSRLYALEQEVRHGSGPTSDKESAHQEYERLVGEHVWRAFGRIRGIVGDVVGGWDALARTRGFRSADAMLSPYLLWCPSIVAYVALARPLDACPRLFAPHAQALDLHTRKGPVRCAGEEGLLLVEEAARLPLADGQLRAAAAMMLDHIDVCTAADRLGVSIKRRLSEPGSSRAATAAAAAPASVGSSRGGGHPTKRQIRKVLGRVTVDDYRQPLWDRRSGAVPRILKAVSAGLTALRTMATARDGAVPVRRVTGGVATTSRFASSSPAADSSMSPMALELAYRSDRRVAGWRAEAALVAAVAATSAASRALLHPRGGVQLLRDDGDVLVASRGQPIARRPSPTRTMTSASAWRLLDAALAQVAVAHGCKFQDLLHTHAVWWDYEARRREGLGGAAAALGGDDAARLPQYLTSSVQLILTDPPFGTRMETSQAQSDHDVLTAADLKAAARLYQVLLRPGGHALICCSFDQRDAWVSELRALQDMGASGKPILAAFRVDSAPMLAIKDAHAFNSRRQSSTNLSNKAEVIIHATRCGADREDAYQAVNFRTFNVVPSRSSRTTMCLTMCARRTSTRLWGACSTAPARGYGPSKRRWTSCSSLCSAARSRETLWSTSLPAPARQWQHVFGGSSASIGVLCVATRTRWWWRPASLACGASLSTRCCSAGTSVVAS